ncbi:hypothetical protein Tco_0093005 [Tanacetum coccineum]
MCHGQVGFLRLFDNKREEGELMRHSIDNRPYKRKEIVDPNDDTQTILEPINKLSPQDQKQYYADIRVMNYILQGIPNDIHNSVDACKDAQTMWNRSKRLMQGTYISKQERHSRLMNSPSYSRSPQPYYVTYPSSMIDYDDDYQGEIQGDAQEDKLSTTMIMLDMLGMETRMHEGQIGIEKLIQEMVSFRRLGNMNKMFKRFQEQSQLQERQMFRDAAAMAKANMQEIVQNPQFIMQNDTLEELNVSVIMMARIQPTDDKSDAEPTYDAKLISEVNASQIDMINGLLSKSDNEH